MKWEDWSNMKIINLSRKCSKKSKTYDLIWVSQNLVPERNHVEKKILKELRSFAKKGGIKKYLGLRISEVDDNILNLKKPHCLEEV